MTGKQEGPYKGEETKAEEDKLWQLCSTVFNIDTENDNKCFLITKAAY